MSRVRKLFLRTAYPAVVFAVLLGGYFLLRNLSTERIFPRALAIDEPVRLAEAPATGFTSAAEKGLPYTVQIRTIRSKDDPFSGLHANPIPLPMDGAAVREEVSPSLVVGSGIVLSEEGLIATALHTVRKARRIQIVLEDGSRSEARLVGFDWASGVALLRAGSSLPQAATIEGIRYPDVGQWVISIGSPFGRQFANSLSAGIISGKKQLALRDGRTLNLLQTDAALEEGSLGGPLLNLRGELIGMSLIPSTINDEFKGVGYAIDRKTLLEVVGLILLRTRANRGWLGVKYRAYDGPKAALRGGVEIVEITPGSGAELAGLRLGDVILKADSMRLTSPESLETLLDKRNPGDRVELEFSRRQSAHVVTVQLGAPPAAFPLEKDEPAKGSTEAQVKRDLGLTLGALTEDLRHEFDLLLDQGVVLVTVDPNESAFIDSDLRMGMVISELADQSVSSPKEFYDIYASIPSGHYFLAMVYKPYERWPFLTALYKP